MVRGEKARRSSCGVEGPVGRVQGDQTSLRAAQQGVGTVILVERLEDDELVARIGDGQQRRDHALGGPAADGDLALRIVIEPVPAAIFRGDGFAERA